MTPAQVSAAPRSLWLIMSGSYVGQELAAELGSLPPAMLPAGNQRLYELQLESLPEDAEVHLVLPEDYAAPSGDRARLAAAGVSIIPLPEGFSLGTAVAYALNAIGLEDHAVNILLGDTLFREARPPHDSLGVAHSPDDYSWADVESREDRFTRLHMEEAGRAQGPRTVACGLFSFSSSSALVRCLIKHNGDFNAAVGDYASLHPMQIARLDDWLDFGHLQTFFRSRRAVTTARAFNQLESREFTVRKSSASNPNKIRAEAMWLRNAPPSIMVYCARVIEIGEKEAAPFYDTEYEYLLTLSELYVFSAIGRSVWERIISASADFLGACASHRGPGSGDEALKRLTSNAVTRLQRFAAESGFDVERPQRYDGRPLPSLMTMAERLQEVIRPGRAETVMHGDFCFSNIFYNTRSRRLRVIDPRGFVREGEPSIFGDLRYDLAKLGHSAIGRYDQIIAGRYSCRGLMEGDAVIEFEEGPNRSWIANAFSRIEVDGVAMGDDQIHAVMIGLFLAMLPLHSDRPDRQHAFICNALRLYAERF